MLRLTTSVVGTLLVGTGALAAVPAQAADPTCAGRPATIVVPAGATAPVDGTEGDDVISVSGNVQVNALGGNDVICGTAPTGTWDGGAGNDTLLGTANGMNGGAGNDEITAGAGYQNINGGDGDDTIWKTGGTGRVVPGPGSDVIHGTSTIVLYVGAATGTTTVDATARTVDGPEGHDTWTGSPTLTAEEATGDMVFLGTNGPDLFFGGLGHDRMYGRGGDDQFSAIHPTLLAGGPGDDSLVAWSGGTVKGGAGDDGITGALRVGDEPVREPFDLEGGPGDDTIGPQSVLPDDDTGAPPSGYWRGTVRGGAGWDRIGFRSTLVPVRASLASGRATWSLGQMRMAGVQALWGTDGNDVLRGDSGRNVLRGLGGKDRAYGGLGRDTCRAEVKRSCER